MPDIKELVVISGKGGTGKTSLTACLASLSTRRVVADCDVDAANLNLLLNGSVVEKSAFMGGGKAVIRTDVCTRCGRCREVCRFGAISDDFVVSRTSCEGCGACHYFCPAGAVEFAPRLCGECFVCRDRLDRPFIFAELIPGEENSGKLVTMVRTAARAKAESHSLPLVLIDGPPGVGCPVISSVTGAHFVLIVTEPTTSGMHDTERVVGLARHFSIPAGLVVNRSDINQEYSEKIRAFCLKDNIAFLGGIPFEPGISLAQRQAKTILEFLPDSAASRSIRQIFEKLSERMEAL